MFTPPFTVHSGDEDPQNPGHPIINTQHGSHPTLPDAKAAANALPQDKFWEIRDANGTVASTGYNPIVHKKSKKTAPPKRSKVVKPKTVKPKMAKTVKPKITKPKRGKKS